MSSAFREVHASCLQPAGMVLGMHTMEEVPTVLVEVQVLKPGMARYAGGREPGPPSMPAAAVGAAGVAAKAEAVKIVAIIM